MDYYVFSGEISSGIILNSYDYMNVFDGGVANSTTVNSMGSMYVSSGGTATHTTVNSGGYMWLESGGTADSTTVNSSGGITVNGGGSANRISVNSGGRVYIFDGGTATNIDWTPCVGSVYVQPGGTVSFVKSLSGVYYGSNGQLLSHATVMTGKTVSHYGQMYVMSGGTAVNTDVYTNMYVWSGGTAYNTNLHDDMDVYSGGLVSGVNVYDDELEIHAGGSALAVSVFSGGEVELSSNAYLRNATVFSGGEIDDIVPSASISGVNVMVGGMVNEFTLQKAATLDNASFALSNVVVTSKRNGRVYDGQSINGVTVKSGGNIISVADLASVTNITVEAGGTIGGFSFGDRTVKLADVSHLSNVRVKATGSSYGCNASVFAGQSVSDVTVESGCFLFISGGGTTVSNVSLEEDAHCQVSFDLRGKTAADDCSISGLSTISTVQSYPYYNNIFISINVDADQAEGCYVLTDEAFDFSSSNITVWNGNIGYSLYPGSETYGKNTYALTSSGNGGMVLAVGQVPVVLTITADITSPTNRNVTVTATFSGNAVYREYSQDGLSWTNYTGGVVMSANGTVFFRAGNAVGYSPVASYTVTNIDKIAPVKPTASANITTGTAQNVTVSATFSGDSVQRQYSLDGKTWQTYTEPLVFQSNGIAYFRGQDAAGNISDIARYVVNNISFRGGRISGKEYVYSGGTATSNTVVSGGIFVIREGGRANDNRVNAGGIMHISGGLAVDTTVNAGGSVRVSSAGNLLSGRVNSGGFIYLFNNGSARSATMISGGRIYVSSGGSSIDNRVSSGGLLLVSSGGSSLRDLVMAGGNVHLYKGAQATSAAVYSQGILRVSSGASAFRVIGRTGAAIHVFSGGRTTSTTIINGGREYVQSMGSATTTIVSSGGLQLVSSGGRSIQAHIRAGGEIYLYTGARGFFTNVSSGGVLRVSSAAVATSAIVRTGGIMNLYGAGVASAALIVSGGRINVQRGCSAADTKVSSGGVLVASAGGTITGGLTIVSGATVRMDSGSVLNFDIRATRAGTAALVNNLSLVKGTPSYTLTVNASQAVGTYRLADGVSSFTGSITVKSGNTNLGTVTTAKALTKNGRQYALQVTGGRLNLAVTAVEGGAEELLQSGLAESCAMNLSSSGAIEEFAGGLNLGITSEESFGAASLFDFDSSTKTAGALLAV